MTTSRLRFALAATLTLSTSLGTVSALAAPADASADAPSAGNADAPPAAPAAGNADAPPAGNAAAPSKDQLSKFSQKLKAFAEGASARLDTATSELGPDLDGHKDNLMAMAASLKDPQPFDATLPSLKTELARLTSALSNLESTVAQLRDSPANAEPVKKLESLNAELKALKAELSTLESKPTEAPQTRPPKPQTADSKAGAPASSDKKAEEQQSEGDKEYSSLAERLRPALSLRCKTAYCFGGSGGTKYAIEPVLDLPFGLVWALGEGGLANYINSHAVNVEFNAGMRFWFAYDQVSVMVYLSRPLIQSSDPIRLDGVPYDHPPSSIRRPYPSLGIGMFGDVVIVGISYDELRNGGTAQRDLDYPPNAVLGRALTFSLGFSLLNAARNAAGTEPKKASTTKGAE